MDSIKDILSRFNPLEDKYISREFQAFGCHLADKLGDSRRKSLYIKLAKTLPRPVLEKALSFVVDSNARSKPALFMWKLKELGIIGQEKDKTEKKVLTKTGVKRIKKTPVEKVKKVEKPKKISKKDQIALEKEYAPSSEDVSLF